MRHWVVVGLLVLTGCGETESVVGSDAPAADAAPVDAASVDTLFGDGAPEDVAAVDVPKFKPFGERSACDPCEKSDQCHDAGSVCAAMGKPFGAAGYFCQLPCDKETPCPAGSVCEGTTTTEGTFETACRPLSNLCGCSAKAKASGWTTPCFAASYGASGQVAGKCPGKWVCDDGGARCDATQPTAEKCDGVDSDCDGETDEGPVCDDGDPCTGGQACEAGKCTAGKSLCACQKDTDCTVNNRCTHRPVCDTSDKVAVCKSEPLVVECDGKSAGACQVSACDPKSGKCALVPGKQGQGCDADGDPCTESDHCDAGKCKAGAAKNCDDGSPCTFDVCQVTQGKVGCSHNNQTGACSDGDACTTGETCKGGKCAGGAPKTCGQGKACQVMVCNAKTGTCDAKPAADDQACADQGACVTGAVCKQGTCSGGKAAVCDDGNPCTTDGCDKAKGCTHSAANSGSCDDGNSCTSGDACTGGKCTGGKNTCGCQKNADCAAQQAGNLCAGTFICNLAVSPHACVPKANSKPVCQQDDSACTLSICDPKTGKCAVTAAKDGVLCDDGQSCTSGDTCKAGKCSGGGQVGCDDGNPCTKDACTASSGKPVCTHQAITGACSDGDACTANDQCAGGVCVSGKAKACTDDNACTTDACDAKTGKCSHGTAGSDGLVCKSGVGACGPAACAKGECVALSKSPCNDDNGCTDDICDKGKGCKHPANTAPCSDNNVCTTADKCAGGACKSGAPRDCDDNNICTLDKCVPSLGTATGCQHTEQAVANCDDGDKCTSEDTCKKGKCKGKKKDCGDDEECTLDTCKDGVCSHDNNAKNGKSCKVHKWCWGYGTCGKGVCIDKPGTCPAKKWQQMWPIVPLKKLRKATTLFDPLGYHVVKVTLPPANWAAYLHQVLTNKKGKTYHKATIDFDGDVYPDIGIRPFGFGSQFYNPSKPNIRMNFDYYDDDAVGPYKRRNIRLKASGQDRAFLKQPLSQSLVQLAGGNAPRWSWARVFVNGQPFGLYQVFEHVDKRFFNANFGNTKGNDYEPSPICRGFNCPSAGCSDLAKYYTKDPGQALEIVALAKVVKDAPDKSWLVDAGKIIAWGPLLAQYAIEAILSDFDSLAAAGNNYELYVNKDTGKMQIIPGGMDLNFGRANSWYDIYKIWGLPNKWCKGRVDHLYQRIVKTAQSKADLDKVINQVRCGPFSNAVLLTLIDGMKVMLADDLYNDPKGIASKNVIDSEFVKLKAYITKRNAYLQGIYGDCP